MLPWLFNVDTDFVAAAVLDVFVAFFAVLVVVVVAVVVVTAAAVELAEFGGKKTAVVAEFVDAVVAAVDDIVLVD